MSLDYNQFRALTALPVPNALRVMAYNKDHCELYNSICNSYGLPETYPYSTNVKNLLKTIKETHKTADNLVYMGIEVELENFRKANDLGVSDLVWDYSLFWEEKEDGSLRNYGREFVSRIGLLHSHLHLALPALEKYVTTVTNNKAEANARTGLHIHLDITQLNTYQLANLLFIYSIFEPIIFHLSGGRDQNIFCIPWETNRYTLGSVVGDLMVPHNHKNMRWRNYSKYCGLNLAAISKYGTIEFRMHRGSYNAATIQRWANFIVNLYLYAKKTDFVDNLNNFRSNRLDYKYWDLFYEIMNEYVPDMSNLQQCKREELIIRCKYATINFLKHFVDDKQLPDSSVVKKKHKNWFDIDVRQLPRGIELGRDNVIDEQEMEDFLEEHHWLAGHEREEDEERA